MPWLGSIAAAQPVTHQGEKIDAVRRTARAVLTAGLALIVSCTLAPELVGSSAAAEATDPPAPDLARFIPSSDQITSTRQIHLTRSGPAQVIVAFESAQTNAQGKQPVDLMILSWDPFAKRWVTVWDGAKVQAPQTGFSGSSTSGALTYDAVIPSGAYISNFSYRPIAPAKGRTDLEFQYDFSFGANGSVEVGIVHYDGQAATLAYYDTFDPADANPKVIGKASHQELSVPQGWLTSADPECCPVRSYVNTVALRQQRYPGGYRTSSYVVTSSTQSWLGVFALRPEQSNGTFPNPVVMTVVPGGPAAGVLQVGDQLVGVSGVSANQSAQNGPAVIDEAAKPLPGTKVALNIIRDEIPMVVNLTMGSTDETAHTKNSSPPAPGYLGVDVTSVTPQVQSQYSLVPASGAFVLSVADNSPAANAGLVQGDVITSFGSTPIASSEALQSAAELTPSFTTVQLGYTDTSGNPRTASVMVGSFPPDSPVPQVISM